MKPVSYGTVSESSVLHETPEQSDDEDQLWHRHGVFQRPLLMVEQKADGELKYHPHTTSSSELFFDLVYATSIAKLGEDLRSQEITQSNYAAYFFALYFGWMGTTRYASQVECNDLIHKVFWAVYMIGVVGMIIHIKGGFSSKTAEAFFACCIFTRCMLVTAFCRLAYYIPTSRYYSLYAAINHSSVALAWFLCILSSHALRPYVVILSVCIDPIYVLCGFRMLKGHQVVYMHWEYYIDRISGFVLIVLGELVAGICIDATGHNKYFYSIIFLGFTVAFCLKMLYFDVDTTTLANHAVKQGLWKSLLWSYSHPLLMIGIALTGSGITMLSQAQIYNDFNHLNASNISSMFRNKQISTLRAKIYICIGVGICYTIFFVHRLIKRQQTQFDNNILKTLYWLQHVTMCISAIISFLLAFTMYEMYVPSGNNNSNGSLSQSQISKMFPSGKQEQVWWIFTDIGISVVLTCISLILVLLNLCDEIIERHVYQIIST